MSKLLILGAGVYQIPLIKHAVVAGHHVVVASWSGKDPGMSLGHESWVIDTTHKEELLQRATASGIEAVTTTGTDVAVPSIGWICDHMRLPGISYATAVKCSNKIQMQAAFSAHDVKIAPHGRADNLEEAQGIAEKVGYPVIVKAPDSSGSRGVVIAQAPRELPLVFEQAMRVSRCGSVLVEKFLSGREFGGQVIVCRGEVQACIFHNDTVTSPPVRVPIGHSCPCLLPSEVQREAEEVCARAVRALEIQNAVCNTDLILTPDGVYILEMGARIGATGIPEIVRLNTGLDLYDMALQFALGQTPEATIKTGLGAAVLIIRSPATGTLVRCRVPPSLRQTTGLVAVKLDYSEGAPVRYFRTGPDRIGDILVTAKTPDAAERLCEQIAADLDIEVLGSAAEPRTMAPC